MLKKSLSTLCFWLLSLAAISLWAQQTALLVSGYDPTSLNPGDQGIKTALQTLGFSVVVKGGPSTPVASSDANNVDLVIISSTVTPSAIGGMFQHVATPVIVNQSYLFDDMKMTGSLTYFDYGIATHVSNIKITDPSHPIAQSLSGTVPVTTANTSLRWGRPGVAADRIARIQGSFKYAIFAYDAGDHMVGMQAPATRIGFFLDTWTASHMTAQGWTLFNQAVLFATAGGNCTADAGTLTIDHNPVSLTNGSATVSATPDGNIHVPNGYSVIYVLTSGQNLVIEQVNSSPTFTVNAAGTYTIHTLVYDGDPNSPDYLDLSLVQFGQTTGADALNYITANGLCASLDVAGAPVHVNGCTADAGTLTIDQDPVVLANGSATVSATPDGNIHVPNGYSVIYVLTSGQNLVIEQVNSSPTFTVTSAGSYTIHTLVYDGDPNSPNYLDLSVVQFGQTTGGDVLNLVTANGLCASLDVAGAPVHVNGCTADAGTLTIDQDPVVLANGSATVSATPNGNIHVPNGYSVIYVLTSGQNLVIEQVNSSPTFTVNVAGNYTIHTLVFDGDPTSPNYLDLSVVQFGQTTGVDVLNLVTANGLCASLDVAGAPVHVNGCTADAGTLTIDQNPVVLANGSATVSATPNGNIHVPNGYSVIYVLTSGQNLVIEQVNSSPTFTVNVAGNYTIHTLVFDGDPASPNYLDLSVVQFGQTTGVDVLNLVTANGLCASLDVAGAPVHVNGCTADAGTLTIDQDPVVLANGSATVSATPDGNIHVPNGYSVIYVLTSGQNLVIEQVNSSPTFTVNVAGNYTIHTLVFDGDPASPNYLDLSVVQFGQTTGVDVLNLVTANGLCASLDVAGAPVHVNGCTADAGTLTIDQDPVVLANGSATVSATPDGNIHVPNGYSVIYVLTSGQNLVIEQVNSAPTFTVNVAGNYTIHTLVFDGDPTSPNYLDLSVVQFGQTTGVDVLNLVTANGICASLDVAGAPVHVGGCAADAGTLTINQSPVSLINGTATVSAMPDGNAQVPNDYAVIFVLTSGPNLVIEQVNSAPSFTVAAAGDYTIHTLVYDDDPTSPNYLDLSVVQFGQTTGVDVLNLINANGLCASLDAAGAPVQVTECGADAGDIHPDHIVSFLPRNDSVTISATPSGNIQVPNGYSVLYVLTRAPGLVIQQVSTQPSFTVTQGGLYRIHTLVYDGNPNSPNYLDLSVVQLGTTSGFDVLNLINNSGICASLDAQGAISIVIEIFWLRHFLANQRYGRVTLSWMPESPVPGIEYVLERSQDGNTFERISSVIETEEMKSIEREVADISPAKGWNTYRLRILDSRGQTIHTEEQSVFVDLTNDISISAYPNPVVSQLKIKREDLADVALSMKVMDMSGREMMPVNKLLRSGEELMLDVSNLPEGFYRIVFFDQNGKAVETKSIHKQ